MKLRATNLSSTISVSKQPPHLSRKMWAHGHLIWFVRTWSQWNRLELNVTSLKPFWDEHRVLMFFLINSCRSVSAQSCTIVISESHRITCNRPLTQRLNQQCRPTWSTCFYDTSLDTLQITTSNIDSTDWRCSWLSFSSLWLWLFMQSINRIYASARRVSSFSLAILFSCSNRQHSAIDWCVLPSATNNRRVVPSTMTLALVGVGCSKAISQGGNGGLLYFKYDRVPKLLEVGKSTWGVHRSSSKYVKIRAKYHRVPSITS